jgi:hypothetical protein
MKRFFPIWTLLNNRNLAYVIWFSSFLQPEKWKKINFLQKYKKIFFVVIISPLVCALMHRVNSWAQFHQCSTRSFCANSIAPVKYKPKM